MSRCVSYVCQPLVSVSIAVIRERLEIVERSCVIAAQIGGGRIFTRPTHGRRRKSDARDGRGDAYHSMMMTPMHPRSAAMGIDR